MVGFKPKVSSSTNLPTFFEREWFTDCGDKRREFTVQQYRDQLGKLNRIGLRLWY